MNIQGTLRAVMAGAALLTVAACTQDLNIPDSQSPDVSRALGTPTDVENLAKSSVNDYYVLSNWYDPWVMLDVTADVMTMNYGNFGARFNNLEPRIPYNNNVASGDAEASARPWTYMYRTLGEANDVLKALKGGVTLPDTTDKYKALAMWSQAGALELLTLVYDSAFAVDEDFDPAATPAKLVGYPDMETFTLGKIDALISFTQGQSFGYVSTDFPLEGGLTSAKLNRFANTMGAQVVAYSPRNLAQANAADWGKVLSYANNGIGTGNAGAPFDFSVVGDDNLWYSQMVGYFDLPSWMMIDMKVVHKMSPNVPDRYTGVPAGCAANDNPCYDATYAPQNPHDARLGIDLTNTNTTQDSAGTDFIYARKVQGDPSRGIWMQSPYYHGRYFSYSFQAPGESFVGPQPWTLAAENDLLRAEALVQTGGDLNVAASLINNTRVTRGGLTPLTSADSKDTFLGAILYEQEVELLATNGYRFFAMRGADSLQVGTVRHLPVPAAELGTDGLPVYTYGGAVENPSGMNMVSGGAATHNLIVGLSHLQQGPTKTLQLPDGRQMNLAIPQPNPRPSRSTVVKR